MIKTLTKHGNSHALLIERGVMEQLGITADTPLQLSVTGDQLVVTPVHVGVGTEQVKDAMDTVRKTYGDTLKRLAE